MSEPKKRPSKNIYSSANTVVVLIEGPGDTTRRPLRPSLRRLLAPEPPREPQPPTDQPPPPA
jgi:hypothetical protein